MTFSTFTHAPTLPEGVEDNAVVMIARQAILNERREVFGYELFDRGTPAGGHSLESDAALIFNAMSYAGTEALVGHKLVFINCTHESLEGVHLELIDPTKVVLEIPALGEAPDPARLSDLFHLLQRLRGRGFKLAFDHNLLRKAYASWLPLANFIKLDMQIMPPNSAEPLVKFIRHNTIAHIIAEKVESPEQFAMMQGLGVKLFQGYWFAKPDEVPGKVMRPAQSIILQLLNLVRQQSSTNEIEEVLKKDPTLSFNLLRFINSSGFGLTTEITSFRHAVMILGLKKLFRWAALLLTTSHPEDTAPAVGQTAIVRGRLMELLAAETLSPEEIDIAFVAGIFSLLDVMLDVPMATALSSISLPRPVVDALLHRQGIYAPYLELVLACENGDTQAFDRAAQALNLSYHQVNWAHLQALAWADTLSNIFDQHH
ncbi:MAG: EAL and HDOD domain-containing protein [Comamonas sp.]